MHHLLQHDITHLIYHLDTCAQVMNIKHFKNTKTFNIFFFLPLKPIWPIFHLMSNDSGVTIREWKPKVYNGDVICLLYRKVGTKKPKNKQNCFILKSTMKEKNTQNSSELFKVTILWIVIFHSASDNQVHPAHFPQALCPLAALSKSSCCTYEWLYSSHPLYNRTIFSIIIS